MSAGENLSCGGIFIQDDFLAPAQIAALLECARSRRAHGDFAAARIGSRASPTLRSDIRGDSICWLQEPLYAPERELLERLEQLRLELNREAFLGLFELEMHYAHYPSGAGYARHVDNARGSSQRILSLALYLNIAWTDSGGALRLFDATEQFLDVAPIGGRLVCFMTARREHAVLPAQHERWSISGWFSRR